jgi:hypothetical protein
VRPLQLPDAAALVAKPAEDKGSPDAAEQPAAQRPTTARPPSVSVQRRPPTRRLEPGDLICPDCGEGNPTTRKFCSRCGASLETAQVVKAKWWQKFKPRRGPKKRKAGDRPSARKTRRSIPQKIMGFAFGGVARGVAAVIIIGGLVYGIVPGVRNAVNDQVTSIKNKVNSWIHPTRTEVLPTDVFTSTAIPGHGPLELRDTATNTYWAAHVPRGNVHITITYSFATAFNLKNLAVWNGVGDAKDRDYNSTLRPDHVFLSFPSTPSVPGCAIQFPDAAGVASKLDVSKCGANGVDEIAIRIDDYYPSQGSNLVTLAKVQFYKG